MLPRGGWKNELGSSEIGRHSSLGTESLDPRVPNLVCSESERHFYIGLEPRLDWRLTWLILTLASRLRQRFSQFLCYSELKPALSHHLSNSFSTQRLEIQALFIGKLTQHRATWSSIMLHHATCSCMSCFGCLLCAICSILTSF